MLKAKPGKAVAFTTSNEIGALARLTKVVAEKGVNVLGASCWVEDGRAVFHVVTDDNLRTVEALRANGCEAEEVGVVAVDAKHKPGILRHIADTLARERIDIEQLYATATISQDHCLVILRASDNERAVILLND